MIDFVKKTEDFEKYKYKFLSLFDEKIDFEENPFNVNFKLFTAFEFDFIYHELFFNEVKCFLKIF